LERIRQRQQLLHKLLQTHESEYYDEHYARQPLPPRPIWRRFGYGGRVGTANANADLTASEFDELQDWLTRLPVVPHLSVVELDSQAKPAAEEEEEEENAALIELKAKTLKPVRVLKGFVDIEREPYTLSELLNQLPPTPAIVADVAPHA